MCGLLLINIIKRYTPNIRPLYTPFDSLASATKMSWLSIIDPQEAPSYDDEEDIDIADPSIAVPDKCDDDDGELISSVMAHI